MNRELLEKPFSPDQIRQREGNFGKMLSRGTFYTPYVKHFF